MECKHKYFHIVEGVLRCAQCDKMPEEIKGGPKIEDKIDKSKKEDKSGIL